MVLAVVIGAQAGEVPTSERRSDYELMGPELRRMQDDDSANPGMLWVFDGEAGGATTGRRENPAPIVMARRRTA